jgi:outer membrane protein OmpA-like peptidoglycan-associated protein
MRTKATQDQSAQTAAVPFFGQKETNNFFGSADTATPTFFKKTPGSISQPTIQRTPLCPATRDAGEVTKSQSPDGILAVDTQFNATKESLSVQDFGIDKDTVTPGMTQTDDWRRMMSMILGDPTTSVAVLGYSDCMGGEQNNQDLRNRRANAVIKAMPPEAQAKVSPFYKGWFGGMTYLYPNDTVENRARNRMAYIALMRSWTDSCDSLPQATNIDQFIFLVSCLEKRLGLTNAADAPKTLSVLRQIYFGNATWSTQRNRSKIWDDVIPTHPWAPGTDPTPKLGNKLLTALQNSKDIKFDNSATGIAIDISHLLTGLDAMMNPQDVAFHVGPLLWQTGIANHELATWAGDVASAATNYTICVDWGKYSATYDDFFKDLADDSDLEGDIDAYAVWAALNSAPGAPVPLQLNLPLSEVLMQYYRLKNTGKGGMAREQRFEVFANFYGANVSGKKMLNRAAFKNNIKGSVSEIAMLSFFKQAKEILNGNTNSIGNCAGGKPPTQTGQPAPVDLATLMVGVMTACDEMIERFTVWIEKRL